MIYKHFQFGEFTISFDYDSNSKSVVNYRTEGLLTNADHPNIVYFRQDNDHEFHIVYHRGDFTFRIVVWEPCAQYPEELFVEFYFEDYYCYGDFSDEENNATISYLHNFAN
jgi:hypothetical protein